MLFGQKFAFLRQVRLVWTFATAQGISGEVHRGEWWAHKDSNLDPLIKSQLALGCDDFIPLSIV